MATTFVNRHNAKYAIMPSMVIIRLLTCVWKCAAEGVDTAALALSDCPRVAPGLSDLAGDSVKASISAEASPILDIPCSSVSGVGAGLLASCVAPHACSRECMACPQSACSYSKPSKLTATVIWMGSDGCSCQSLTK